MPIHTKNLLTRNVVCRKDAKLMNQRLAYVLSEYREKLNEIGDLDRYTCSQKKY